MHNRNVDKLPRHGFSLVEALVAIALTGILALAAMPSVSWHARQYRLVGAASQIAFDIARARMQAVGQHLCVRIRFVDASHYIRERSVAGITYVADDVIVALPSGITAPDAPTTTFNRDGVGLAATTIHVTNGEITKQVDTNILGRVTIS